MKSQLNSSALTLLIFINHLVALRFAPLAPCIRKLFHLVMKNQLQCYEKNIGELE